MFIGSSFAFEWGRLAGAETILTITIKMTASLPVLLLFASFLSLLLTEQMVLESIEIQKNGLLRPHTMRVMHYSAVDVSLS